MSARTGRPSGAGLGDVKVPGPVVGSSELETIWAGDSVGRSADVGVGANAVAPTDVSAGVEAGAVPPHAKTRNNALHNPKINTNFIFNRLFTSNVVPWDVHSCRNGTAKFRVNGVLWCFYGPAVHIP